MLNTSRIIQTRTYILWKLIPSILAVILIPALNTLNETTAPCEGVYFKVDVTNYPMESTADRSHFLYYYGDTNLNSYPDEIEYMLGDIIPYYYTNNCTNQPMFVCMAAYWPGDLELDPVYNKWRPKANTYPICIIRHSTFY